MRLIELAQLAAYEAGNAVYEARRRGIDCQYPECVTVTRSNESVTVAVFPGVTHVPFLNAPDDALTE